MKLRHWLFIIVISLSVAAFSGADVSKTSRVLNGNHSLSEVQKRLSVFNSSRKIHCSDMEPVQDPGRPEKPFMTQINCEFGCADLNPQTANSSAPINAHKLTVSARFDPFALGLTEGDGGYLTPLSVTLSRWARLKCVQSAAIHCGGQEKITKANLIDISSGEWKAAFPVTCSSSQARVISPFDSSVIKKLDYVAAETKPAETKPAQDEIEFKTSEVIGQVFDEYQKPKKPQTCAVMLTADICFGDCIDLEEKETVATLATKESLANTVASVCGDQLIQAFKEFEAKAEKKLSKVAREALCEDYFWRSYRAGQGWGSSCAAIRGKVNCADFLQ